MTLLCTVHTVTLHASITESYTCTASVLQHEYIQYIYTYIIITSEGEPSNCYHVIFFSQVWLNGIVNQSGSYERWVDSFYSLYIYHVTDVMNSTIRYTSQCHDFSVFTVAHFSDHNWNSPNDSTTASSRHLCILSNQRFLLLIKLSMLRYVYANEYVQLFAFSCMINCLRHVDQNVLFDKIIIILNSLTPQNIWAVVQYISHSMLNGWASCYNCKSPLQRCSYSSAPAALQLQFRPLQRCSYSSAPAALQLQFRPLQRCSWGVFSVFNVSLSLWLNSRRRIQSLSFQNMTFRSLNN